MIDTEVLVIGGGISGLSTAWWLTQRGVDVRLWEQSDRPGGKIHSARHNGFITERAAALVTNYRPEVTELINTTGLDADKRVRVPDGNRYLLHGGRLVVAPTSLRALMKSPLISLRGRIRLACEPFIPNGSDENESVGDFIRRRLGGEILDKLIEPLIAGPLASDAETANASALLPRLTTLEQRFGSLAGGVLMKKWSGEATTCVPEVFSFIHGMSSMTDALGRSLGARFFSRHKVIGLEPVKAGWRATANGPGAESSITAKYIVLSLPAPTASSLLDPVDSDLSAIIRSIKYASLVAVHLGMERASIKHKLDGTGFLVGRQEKRPLIGSLWMDSLFPGHAPAGKALFTSYLGGSRAPEVAGWNDQQIIDATLATLGPLLGLSTDPEIAWIDRHDQALPLYEGYYPELLRAIARRLDALPGLHIAANYSGGVSVRDRVVCGHTLANRIAESMGRCPTVLDTAFPRPDLTRAIGEASTLSR